MPQVFNLPRPQVHNNAKYIWIFNFVGVFLLNKLAIILPESMSKAKKVWIVTTAMVLIIAGIIVFYYQDWIKAYYQNLTNNHYHEGDPIEINEQYISALNYADLPLCRISKSDTNYDQIIAGGISGKKMKQYNIKSIGTYIGYELIQVENKNGQKTIASIYAIKPDARILEQNPKSTGLKPGYKYIDDNYYILWTNILK
ncbi:MAG TPA: hypothetical protein VL442_20320 [Mucilaginibacter sp.]|jgi:hypothetical protein|nr:hypothetical protein [Mucilaginibacter sp.]